MKRTTDLIFRILILIIASLLACEDNRNPLSSNLHGKVEITLILPSEKPDEKAGKPRLLNHIDIASVNVQITGTGISPAISQSLIRSGNQFSGTISRVPIGTNRTFTIRLFDRPQLILTGQKVTDISAGSNAITFSSEDFIFASDVVFRISEVSGDGQSEFISTALPNPFVVRAENQTGNGVAGFSITFSVTNGSGTVSQSVVQTLSKS